MSVLLRKGIRALIRTTGVGDNPPAGQRALIPKSDGWYDRDSAGAETNLNLSGGSGVETHVKQRATVSVITNVASLSGTPIFDLYQTVAGDRVLLVGQTTASQNGVWVIPVGGGAWTRATDMDTAAKVSGAEVAVERGFNNGGRVWGTNFKVTDTLGTTSMLWGESYSDVNPPESLERTMLTPAPATPGVGRTVEWSTDGKSLDMKAADGTVTRIGPANGIAAVLANSTVTAETVVATFTLPAGYLAAGSMIQLDMFGQVSAAATLTYRVRIGTAGTTADALAITFTTTAAGVANAHARVMALLSCLTAGAAGTATGNGQAQLVSGVVGAATAAYAAATVNTTVALKVTVTVQQSVAQTHTTRAAVLRRVA